MCLNFFKEEIKINKLLYYFIIFCLFSYVVYTSYGIYKQKKSMGIEAERHQEYMKEQRRQTEEQRRQTEILKEIQRQNQQK